MAQPAPGVLPIPPDPSVITAFVDGSRSLGITLDDRQLARFQRYCELLQEWNQRVNLTAITETGEVYSKHFLDSLTVAPLLPTGPFTLIDIGTGGGFPGLPVAIARPDAEVTLLEAHGRKTAFLDAVAADLHLTNVTVLTGRAEEVAHQRDRREAYEVAVTRAVDTLAVLAEYQLPFCRIGGVALALKKGDVFGEIELAAGAIDTLGGHLRTLHPVTAPDLTDDRTIIVIDKLRPTSHLHPRRPGLPSKRPLK